MKKKKNLFERFANWAMIATGSSGAFMIALGVIIVWGISGPVFHYSDTWQLVINTSTTIVILLMVFLIQKSQNKDSKAVHLKLNELLASHEGTSNRMVDIEDLTEDELDRLHNFYVILSDLAEKEDDLTSTYSIDAANENQHCPADNQPEARAVEISRGPDGNLHRLIQTANQQLTVDHWPFEENSFQLYYECRLLKQLQFKNTVAFANIS